MQFRRSLSFGLASACALVGQDPGKAAAPEQLIQEIRTHSELMKNLEELCDGIGARLTGSTQLRAAQAWAMAKLKSYGAVNVHEEAYDFGKPWRRGVARARLLNANGQSLNIAQMGWTEGTRGVVKGDVVVLDVKTLAEFKAIAPGLAGKIVLVISRPRATAEERKDMKAYWSELTKAWRKTPFGLVLLPADKDYSLHEMGGGPSFLYQSRTAFITKDDANLLQRLISRGVTPRVEAELGGAFGKTPVKAYNVVADFSGTDAPEEMVIVGGHLDSWDLSTGATDNGTGTVVAMEVLRAMAASELKPKRTLRIVLFSGEEQGLLGSKAYVTAHRKELPNIQAVLIDDAGTGRMTGFGDMKVEAWYAPLAAAMAPAKALGAEEIPYAYIGGSDQEAFFEKGVPAFSPIQDPLDYRTHTHHSQVDSLDHVVKEDLLQGAQVMAVTTWGLLNGERIPHIPETVKP
jgi:carboxypeptidase Q